MSRKRRSGTSHDHLKSPTPKQLTRYKERRQAHLLGIEVPLTTNEAADYIGYHPKTVERMARAGEIPAHPVSGAGRKSWRFYASELDAWLRAKVQPRRKCSPDREVI